MQRTIAYMGNTQKTINNWPTEIREMVNTNLQSLQRCLSHSFSDLPDFSHAGKITDKALKGRRLKHTHQLTIKDEDSYRVVYIAQYNDKVFVIHAFKKKVEGVDKKAMKTIDSRLSVLKRDRQAGRI